VSLQVTVLHDPRIDYALQQNAVPVVHELALRLDEGSQPLRDLLITVQIEPEISERWEARVESLAPGGEVVFAAPEIVLRPEALVNLEERSRASLVVLVHGREGDEEPEVLRRTVSPIDLLAYNEWPGLVLLPELIAAFVLPNHPAVAPILVSAAGRLEGWTGNANLDAYQTADRDRPRLMVAAIHDAIRDLGITYVEAPASFEEHGQKVRTPDQVTREKLGNCLDLTCLMASCLEQAGLHPVIVFLKDHAVLGAWLVPSQFTGAAVDPLRVKKRAELSEVVLLEVTHLTHADASFDETEAAGLRAVDDQEEHRVAVDIREARARGIRPLPARLSGGSGWRAITPLSDSARKAPAPSPLTVRDSLRQRTSQTLRRVSAEPAPERIARWTSHLLDLTLRNRLLNYRETRRAVPLLVPDVPALEDTLSAGTTLSVWAKPDLLDGRDPRDPELLRRQTGEDVLSAYLGSHLKEGIAHAVLGEAELRRRLVELFRTARTALGEGGANVLFLAVGFLRWFEGEHADEPRLAPLLLVPVELVRRNARETPRLRISEDEARFNVTLARKLLVDFGIDIDLRELPGDQRGVDVRQVLDAVRTAIVDVPRWEVVEQAHISVFSFQKFLMWRDLDARADSMMSSPVVRHLVHTSHLPYAAEAPAVEPDELDGDRPLTDIFAPLDADSTQLSAILGAHDGTSFVLEGPPGTGKSQTITNLIAHNLAHGRTVLFVSEKMAALDVVYGRLSTLGLEPFCLELHSNRSRKQDVIEQLRVAVESARKAPPEGWEAHCEHLQEVRDRLNGYAAALHESRPAGLSVWEAIGVALELLPIPAVTLTLGGIDEVDVRRARRGLEAVRRVQQVVGAVHPVAEHGLRGVGLAQFDAREGPAREQALLDGLVTVRGWRAALHELSDSLEVPRDRWDRLAELDGLLDLLQRGPLPPDLLGPNWEQAEHDVRSWQATGRSWAALWGGLSSRWTNAVVGVADLAALHQRFSRWSGRFVLFAWVALFGARRLLEPAARGLLPANRQITDDLETALSLRAQDKALGAAGPRAMGVLRGFWKGTGTDWDGLDDVLERARQLRVARDAATDPGRARLLELAETSPQALTEGRVAQAIALVREGYAAWQGRFGELTAVLAPELDAFGDLHAPGLPDRINSTLSRWAGAQRSLREWTAWVEASRAAEAEGLGPVVQCWLDGSCVAEQIADVGRRALADWLIEAAHANDPRLAGTHGLELERRVAVFRELDARAQELSRQMVRARLAARMPRADAEVGAGEMGLLQRQFKRKRHIPTRKLLEQIPNLLPRLTPCLLMSPLSVAQYLDADFPPFDLVVFDEASQIPVWDAIGAMARGKQVIVVGDSRQLPPTSFFTRQAEEDPDDEGDYEEMESVLDECIVSRLPRRRLGWHYRSQHESLIAFSNAHYYDGDLLTFPSAAHEVPHLGVSLVPVPGIYDKGKSRTNRKEADAVVADVLARLRSPQNQVRSIGVVTFSLAQQRLIEDLLDEARQNDASLERWFGDGVPEPVFIKNLENVQGDERDVILFSVCYGPDADGRLTMNFGPLNNRGGERRLNVAVTRARQQLVVFSSLRPDQIDLSRSGALGVHHLRSFLQFAQRGSQVLPVRDATEAPMTGALLDTLAGGLRDLGWVVDAQVGESDARVDLAVQDPARPGRYLLGIETDGPGWASAATARDRDRLRSAVRERLGWRLVRVWSQDVRLDCDREVERLHTVLNALVEGAEDEVITGANAGDGELVLPQLPVHATQPELPPAQVQRHVFRRAVFPVPPSDFDTDSFYAEAGAQWLRAALPALLDGEAPLNKHLALRRLIEPFGFKRVGKKAGARIEALAANLPDAPRDADGFWWRHDQSPASWWFVRTADGSDARQAEELPLQEIAAAAEQILRDCVALGRADLARATAQLFGIRRMGSRVAERFQEGIELLVHRGHGVLDGDDVRLP